MRSGLKSEKVSFNSENTKLLGVLTRASAAKGIGALLLHPHPLYGGGPNDRVIMMIESTVVPMRFDSFRFGFRGSSSTPAGYDGVAGAVEDAEAARTYMITELGLDRIIYIGYSFGGSVALRLAASLSPSALVTLSASASLVGEGGFDLAQLHDIECPTLLLHGCEDMMIPCSDAGSLAELIGPSAEQQLLEEGDHFYGTTLRAAMKLIEAFVADLIDEW